MYRVSLSRDIEVFSEAALFQNLSIIIVNYSLKKDTADCIRSILMAGANLSQFIIVDNGSTDQSIDFLRSQFGPDLDILALEDNKGFAEGVNYGLRQAFKNQADWLLIINNDTTVATDFLLELENATKKSGEKYRLYSPLILYYDHPDIIWSVTDRLVAGTMISYNPYIHKKVDSFVFSDVFASEFINGCAMLIHREVFERIGLFDSDFFMYHEEVDLCWRAKKANLKMAIATKARMWHKKSMAFVKQKPQIQYLQIRNQIRVYRRYAVGIQKPVMFLFSIFRFFKVAMQDILNGQPDLLPFLWKGFLEGYGIDLKPRK